MKTSKLKLLTIIAAAIFTASCSNDDDSAPTPKPKSTMLISKIYSSNDNTPSALSDSFTYDANNRVTSQVTNIDAREYTWNSAGQIIKATIDNGSEIQTVTYSYTSSGQLQSEQTTSGGGQTSRSDYTYLANRIKEQFTSINGSYSYEYYYGADGKNIVTTKRYNGVGAFQGSEEYVFDDSKGVEQIAPYSDIPKPFHNANNIIKKTAYDYDGLPGAVYNYTLTFDGAGNPLTVTDDYIWHQVTTLEYIAR